MINDSINALSAGRDPVGIVRDPHENECIVFDASSYRVEALAGTGN
jgi:hypothetical protein